MLYQSPRAGKIYKPAADLEGEVNITLASKISNNALMYDEAGHRFAFYYNTSDGLGVKKYDPLYFIESEENTNLIKAIPTRDGNVSAVNPNKLPEDQESLVSGNRLSVCFCLDQCVCLCFGEKRYQMFRL